MKKNNFGRELEIKNEFGVTLDEYKDLMLFHLEDYLFQTKFNDKVTNINIPALGINFSTEQRYALDLHSLFDIPQISFDERGCIYNNGEEGAYISPEFFEKCFIERVSDVWTSLYKLYMPRILIDRKKQAKRAELDVDELGEGKKQLQHIDFVDAYNKLVALRRLNQDLTQGLIGLGPNFSTTNSIINLRKIEIAAQIQKNIEYVLGEFSKEQYEEQSYDYSNDSFCESQEFKKLEEEHNRLFRNGPFVDPLEPSEWETRGRTYDEGTDEERENWKKEYQRLKQEFEAKGLENIKSEISTKVFPLSVIQKRVLDYLKTQIYRYDYQRNQGAPGNPYINELGLDKTAYYAHPADKHMPERLNRKLTSYDISDATSEDYDVLYGYMSDWYDELDENYSAGNYRRF